MLMGGIFSVSRLKLKIEIYEQHMEGNIQRMVMTKLCSSTQGKRLTPCVEMCRCVGNKEEKK